MPVPHTEGSYAAKKKEKREKKKEEQEERQEEAARLAEEAERAQNKDDKDSKADKTSANRPAAAATTPQPAAAEEEEDAILQIQAARGDGSDTSTFPSIQAEARASRRSRREKEREERLAEKTKEGTEAAAAEKTEMRPKEDDDGRGDLPHHDGQQQEEPTASTKEQKPKREDREQDEHEAATQAEIPTTPPPAVSEGEETNAQEAESTGVVIASAKDLLPPPEPRDTPPPSPPPKATSPVPLTLAPTTPVPAEASGNDTQEGRDFLSPSPALTPGDDAEGSASAERPFILSVDQQQQQQQGSQDDSNKTEEAKTENTSARNRSEEDQHDHPHNNAPSRAPDGRWSKPTATPVTSLPKEIIIAGGSAALAREDPHVFTGEVGGSAGEMVGETHLLSLRLTNYEYSKVIKSDSLRESISRQLVGLVARTLDVSPRAVTVEAFRQGSVIVVIRVVLDRIEAIRLPSITQQWRSAVQSPLSALHQQSLFEIDSAHPPFASADMLTDHHDADKSGKTGDDTHAQHESSSIPAWVWVLLSGEGLLAVMIIAIVVIIRRCRAKKAAATAADDAQRTLLSASASSKSIREGDGITTELGRYARHCGAYYYTNGGASSPHTPSEMPTPTFGTEGEGAMGMMLAANEQHTEGPAKEENGNGSGNAGGSGGGEDSHSNTTACDDMVSPASTTSVATLAEPSQFVTEDPDDPPTPPSTPTPPSPALHPRTASRKVVLCLEEMIPVNDKGDAMTTRSSPSPSSRMMPPTVMCDGDVSAPPLADDCMSNTTGGSGTRDQLRQRGQQESATAAAAVKPPRAPSSSPRSLSPGLIPPMRPHHARVKSSSRGSGVESGGESMTPTQRRVDREQRRRSRALSSPPLSLTASSVSGPTIINPNLPLPTAPSADGGEAPSSTTDAAGRSVNALVRLKPHSHRRSKRSGSGGGLAPAKAAMGSSSVTAVSELKQPT